jgi:acetoin:2,6-dichlorophenolindophenol oxidoreductase subunit beta
MNFLSAMHQALAEALEDPKVLLCGQLVKYGLGGLTEGLHERFPRQVITFPVAENLMNGAAMGLALAGYRPIVIHERMDFLAVGMDPLVNHIPVWPARAPMSLPVVIFTVVGKGKGQGPQHSKNLTPWFQMLDGWKVVQPADPVEAWESLREAVRGDRPVLYVAHREFFLASSPRVLPQPDRIGLCGASKRHEEAFYR